MNLLSMRSEGGEHITRIDYIFTGDGFQVVGHAEKTLGKFATCVLHHKDTKTQRESVKSLCLVSLWLMPNVPGMAFSISGAHWNFKLIHYRTAGFGSSI